ncbi:hypothetical protein C8Q75DRAFT_471706 [Abortiporus biennis]|nr:hypothetical protein C8Q75DRAFT_471706 [Abortiporus biennis]
MDAKLIQLIVNHLHDDTEALDSCSLVSHAWLQSSRSHRFRRITLALTRLIWDSELDELLEFLEGAKFVKEYVVELYLLGPAKYRGSAIGPRRLYRILDQLPVLRELYMVGGRFGGHGEPTFTPSRRFDLDRLTIRSCGSATEDTAYDFATFIDLFHTVDGMVAFDLVYNEPRSVGRGLPLTPASPLVVQSFWLFSPPSLILPILRSRAELPKLRKVAVDSKYLIKDPKELTLFRDFLSQNGAYIEKLYFDISEPFRYSENTGGFTLEGCTSLKASICSLLCLPQRKKSPSTSTVLKTKSNNGRLSRRE